MTRMPRLPGLFAAEILVGETGEEYFHVLGDEEPTQVYYPAVPRCTRKAFGGCGRPRPPPISCSSFIECTSECQEPMERMAHVQMELATTLTSQTV